MIKHLTLPQKIAALALLAGVTLSTAPVQAASYPTKQIELIVPYAAGGGTDLVARAFADAAKNHLPVSVGVINKPGGGGAIGLSEIAAARPNGYKIGLGTVELTTLPSLGMVRFKTSDFKPIARLNADPAAITVRADAPWNSYDEFMTYAKANPGKVRIGNSGTGAIWHLAAAALEDKTGAKFSHVPYDGAAPAITGLLGGHIEAVAVSPGEVINHVKGGKLKTLVVMADERVKTMPAVPHRKRLSSTVVVALLLCVVAGTVIFNAADFPATAIETDPGASAFPTFYACALIVLAILLVIRNSMLTTSESPLLPQEKPAFRKTTAGIATTAFYIVAMSYCGYLITTPVFLIIIMTLMGYRRWLLTPVIALLLTAILWLLFVEALQVPLPVGTFFE